MSDKTGRLITNLMAALKSKEGELKSKEGELKAMSATLGEAHLAAVEQYRREGDLLRQLERVQSRIVELDQLNSAAVESLRATEAELAACHAALAASEATCASQAANLARLTNLEDRARTIESDHAALSRILDGVRDRMRRRELEAESAILNRRVVRSLSPQRNR